MHFQELSHAYSRELRPETPMETHLAHELALVELDLRRQRGFAEQLLLTSFHRIAADVLRGHGMYVAVLANPSLDNADEVSRKLLSKDFAERRAAEKELAEFGYSLDEILSRAYEDVSRSMQVHEDRIARLEIRRRRLLEDYDRLKAKRSRPTDVIEIDA